ncbi:LysR substrate-binding domain-containing protein [Pseudaminobacter soli (ex Li et al. 2025)]|uniref:LysR family transcriptional regulator n=1 Tax=Pseudaminobacter soli (ex Li et al. 2025) TaxID=1295366 RepID=A0A2P7SG73_9HYPH|nr:LysR substrate-binding domain-containing protein [Mesorhizobium soli]PSJ61496.1 LysR family transcriptional regulator [Mesorhizobium soli]
MLTLNNIHLNGLRAVEVVARRGSLLKAAEELGVSPSAVSQQINRTEKQLGRTLFERTPAGLVPTEFGLAFTARLAAGFRELAQAVSLADDRTANTLIVSVAPAFASRWLVPRLSRFFKLHPEILVRIDASTQIVDLGRSDVDVAIRLGEGHWPGARAELLLPMEIFPVCSPHIARKLKSIDDLARSWVIIDENSMISWESWFQAAGVAPVMPQQGASFTDPILCLESVIAGHGIMLAWQFLAADALADGRLVAPFGISAQTEFGHYLVTAEGQRPSRKVDCFRNWINEEVKTTVANMRAATPHAAPGGGVQPT